VHVRRLRARVDRLGVWPWARAAAAAEADVTVAVAAGAADGAAHERVVVVCRCEGRAGKGKVHLFACEERRARWEALARERPVVLATSASANDEYRRERDEEDGEAGDG
jgi:hypothetical protein